MNNVILKLLSKIKSHHIKNPFLYLFSFESLYLFIINLIEHKAKLSESEFSFINDAIHFLVKKDVHYAAYVAHQVIHEIDLKSLVGNSLEGKKELLGFLACYLQLKDYTNFTHKILDLYPECAHYEVKNIFLQDLKTGKDRFNLIFLSIFSHDKDLFLKVIDKIEPNFQQLFLELVSFINNHESRLDMIHKSSVSEERKTRRDTQLNPFINSSYLGLEWLIQLKKVDLFELFDEQFYLYESLFKTQYFWDIFEQLSQEQKEKAIHKNSLYNFVLIRMQYHHWEKEKELFRLRSYIDFLEKRGYDFSQRFIYKFEYQTIVTIILLIKTIPNYFLVGLLLEEILSKPNTIIEREITLDSQKRSIFQILKINRYSDFISLIEQKILLQSLPDENDDRSGSGNGSNIDSSTQQGKKRKINKI
jgi:hypothetical protein